MVVLTRVVVGCAVGVAAFWAFVSLAFINGRLDFLPFVQGVRERVQGLN